MPIVKAKPTTPTQQVVSIPKIQKEEFKSNVVDTKYEPIPSLMTYVEGSAWTVDYYSQVIDTDTALAGQDIGQSGIYQQYKVIRKFDLKVSSALSWSQNNETKSMSANGSAHIHSLVIPNHGDMFIADIGDGREGVFQVKSSEKKSLFKESVYFIEYEFVYISDSDTDRRADLDSKVVQELYYKRDFLEHGQNPLITEKEYNTIEELQYRYKELINHYFRWFFSKQFNTLIIPGQQTKIYDHGLVSFMSSILNTDEAATVKFMRIMNCDDDLVLREPSIWTALLHKDKSYLRLGYSKTGLVSTKTFSPNVMLEGIRFSGLDYVVYPKDHTSVDQLSSSVDVFSKVLAETTLDPVPTRGGNLSDLIYSQTLELNNTEIRMIRSVLSDEYYVLTENFYRELPNQTLLEVMVRNYFQEEKNDPVVLLKLVNSYSNWGGLERFYYIPLLLVLIKDIIRST